MQMSTLFSAFVLLGISVAAADDLGTLKVAAVRYVNEVKTVLALRKPADCIEVIDDADEFAAAKTAFYDEARQDLPTLVKMMKGQQIGGGGAKELISILLGYGQDQDEEATVTLELELRQCRNSEQGNLARKQIELSRQIADRFFEDLARLERTRE